MITLFIGDNDSALAKKAKDYDPLAFLIDYKNYQKFLSGSNKKITAYTSLSDLPPVEKTRSAPFDVFYKADKIFYCPPTRWSDFTENFKWTDQQQLTEYYLHLINLEKNNVVGLDLSKYTKSLYLEIVDQRNSQLRTLWISGCSISHGVGVKKSERFGEIIAAKLNLPVVHLTKGGSSIEWAADQILRSDIKKDDIVIWGITSEHRTPCAINRTVRVEKNLDILMDETRLYHAITKVHQVINFCKKMSAQLILLPIICSENLRLLMHHLDEYHQLPFLHTWIDCGTDDLHPGPLQHQFWANFCIKLIERN